jgi:hypothetical protein
MFSDVSSVPAVPLVVLFGTLAAGPASAGEPVAGEVRTCQVVSVALNVGSLEKEAKRVVYAPPPGWCIRSHTVECRGKFGSASYAVNTVPADFTWDATERSWDETKVRGSGSATVKATTTPVQAGASYRVEKASGEEVRRSASHHALVVEATARGGGLLGSGAGLELTVTADLVYVGPERAP